MSKLLCKFLAPWKGRVLYVCPELALTYFEMKTSISVAVRESGDGIGVLKLPNGYAEVSVFFRSGIPSSSTIESAKALLLQAEILSVHIHWEEGWSQARQ